MSNNLHQSAFLQVSDVVLMQMVKIVPQEDRESLMLSNLRLKRICRLISSNTGQPPILCVKRQKNCCHRIFELAESIENGLDFTDITKISISVSSNGDEPNCTKFSHPFCKEKFSGFVNSNLKFKFVHLELPQPFFFTKQCPLPIIIRLWLQKQANHIEKLFLHDAAISWIGAREKNPDSIANFGRITFASLEHLEVGGFLTNSEHVCNVISMSPKLKSFHACGKLELQYQIPKNQIHLVTWLAVYEKGIHLNENQLNMLAGKKPSLKRIDINIVGNNDSLCSSVANILISSQLSLEEMFCSTFQFWSDPNFKMANFFPNLHLLSLHCNYNQLAEDATPLRRLRLAWFFPNLIQIRLLDSTENNIDIFEGLPPLTVSNTSSTSVTVLGLDKMPSKGFLNTLKSEFPAISRICLRDMYAIYEVSASWNNLEHLEVYEDRYKRRAYTLAGILLGIHECEFENLQQENSKVIRNIHLTAGKSTVTDMFLGLKTLTVKYCNRRFESNLHWVLQILFKQRSKVQLIFEYEEFHSYEWEWSECI